VKYFGDLVIDSKGKTHAVKRLVPSSITACTKMVTFPANSLGEGCPERDVFVSDPHPIFYKGVRKPASCFVGYNGITVSENKDDPKMNFKLLYTLQFDHEASFLVEGLLEVQSHSPYHELEPLPKELRRKGDEETRRTRDSLTYLDI